MQIEILLQNHHQESIDNRYTIQDNNIVPEQVDNSTPERSATEDQSSTTSSTNSRKGLNGPDNHDPVAELAEVSDDHRV